MEKIEAYHEFPFFLIRIIRINKVKKPDNNLPITGIAAAIIAIIAAYLYGGFNLFFNQTFADYTKYSI